MGELIAGFFLILGGAALVLFRQYVRVLDLSDDDIDFDTLETMQEAPPAPRWIQRLNVTVGIVAIVVGIVFVGRAILEQLRSP